MLCVVVAAVGWAFLLRWSGIKRPGILAGLLTAVLLGPTICGRVFPEWQRQTFVGGVSEVAAFDDLVSLQSADVNAMQAAKVSEAAVGELRTKHVHEIEEAESIIQEAQTEYQSKLHTVGMFLVGLLLVWTMPKFREIPKRQFVTVIHSAFALSSMFVFVTAIVGSYVVYVMQQDVYAAIAMGIIFTVTGIGIGEVFPVAFSKENTVVNGQQMSEQEFTQMINGWFRFAQDVRALGWLAGLVMLAVLFSISKVSEEVTVLEPHILMRGFMTGLIIMFIFSFAARYWGFLLKLPVALIGQCVVLPMVVAIAVLSLDMMSHMIWLPLILGLIIGGDGRWLGASLGVRLMGLGWYYGMRVTSPLADAGVIQVVITYCLWLGGWLPTEGLLLAGIVGALSSDLSIGVRQRMLAMTA